MMESWCTPQKFGEMFMCEYVGSALDISPVWLVASVRSRIKGSEDGVKQHALRLQKVRN